MDKRLLYLLLFILAGCGAGTKKSPKVFFSGEIVNPTSDHVVLYKGDLIIDSSRLDEDNMFSFVLDSIEDGLYHFNHSPEYQYVYLEKGDSLLIRLNTVDFDESLVFSGHGEEINNFLMELYLIIEKEEKTIPDYYSLGPTEFIRKMDSLAQLKLDMLSNLKKEAVLSEKGTQIAEATIVYNYATFKERYPFKHRKYTQSKEVPKLSKDFYAYREHLSYANSDFTYLRPYYSYMTNHFGNLAYMTCSAACNIQDKMVKNHLHFNKHKLKLIDSLVPGKELKDNLFRNVAIDYLLKVRDTEENNEIFIKVFHALSGNNRHIDEITDLYEGIRNIRPNKKIPHVELVDFNGESASLQKISKNRKTVFYFWSSSNKKHFDDIAQRVHHLSKEKPEYTFVGVNIRSDEDEWKTLVLTSGLDTKNQYKCNNFEELTRALIIYPMNKCVITNDDMIVDAFANIYYSF